jgi:Fe-S-cluster-containing hydrogenase component 2
MYLVTVNTEDCTGCAQCAESCPSQIITMVERKAQVTGEVSECLGCQSCAIVCAPGGITVEEY